MSKPYESPFTPEEERLIEEWPDVLGRMAIVSRQKPTPFYRALRAKDLAHMKRWVDPSDDPWALPIEAIGQDGQLVSSNPIDCIRECLMDAFRLRMNTGDMRRHDGEAVTATYILVYLCRRRAMAWNLLRIFVPLLRPGALDPQTRGNIEFMFIEHAWGAVFDFDDLREPERGQFINEPPEPFDWPRSLNAIDDDTRGAMLDYAGVPPLPDAKRPAIAPWNERWFNLAWLWNDGV